MMAQNKILFAGASGSGLKMPLLLMSQLAEYTVQILSGIFNSMIPSYSISHVCFK